MALAGLSTHEAFLNELKEPHECGSFNPLSAVLKISTESTYDESDQSTATHPYPVGCLLAIVQLKITPMARISI